MTARRETLPRAGDFTRIFARDWQRLSKAGRFDLGRMKAAMPLLVANDGPLGTEWLDHRSRANGRGIANAMRVETSC